MTAPTSSSTNFWSQHQSRPASRGENIQPDQFIIRKPGKVQPHVHLHKAPNSYSYRLKHRAESADGNRKGQGQNQGHGNLGESDGGPYSQSALQFRPAPTHNFTQFESNGDELKSKQFKATSRSSRHGQPYTQSSETPRLPPRPGTVGAYPSKPNVYRNYSNQTPNQSKFVPTLPLKTTKWTNSPDPDPPNPKGQRSASNNPTLIPIPVRNPFGFISNKLRDRVTQAQRITCEEQSTHQGFSPAKRDCHLSPLSANYPPIVPYLFPTSLPTFTDGDLHPSLSILRTCDQFSPIPMDLVFRDMKKLRKVGEGVYGEVYLGSFGFSDTTESVYKIVAVEGNKLVNGEKQKRFEEIEPEIIVSAQLNKLRENLDNYTTGMAKLHRARLCQGKYPPTCALAWKQWDKENKSENELPDFEDSQLYIIFEYEFAGIDAESYKFRSAAQSFSLLMQVVHTLAVAEAGISFEHRDLHWGNILIKSTARTKAKYIINGQECYVPTEGILATIIDFTISRSDSADDNGDHPAFTDLAEDHEQFTGTDDYQFEIYRMMKAANGNEWSGYHPETNIFWTHYLADKLLVKARYADKSSREHMSYMKRIQRFKDNILQCPSCTEFVKKSPKTTMI